MFSAVFVDEGISKSSIIKSMFWAAINHSHISVLLDSDEMELQEREMARAWREAVSEGDLWGFSGGGCSPHLETVGILLFFSSIRSQLKPARLGCLWLQLLWRSWWPVNYRSCYSYSSVQLWKTYFPLFLLFLRFKSPASVSFIKRPLAPGKL